MAFSTVPVGRGSAAEIPRCELSIMPGLGHVPHLEAPEPFHRRVLAFLADR